MADSQKDVPESDEGNNENTANITVLPNHIQVPDLIVTKVWTEPTSPVEGQAYVVKATVFNQGTTPANPGGLDQYINMRFYLGETDLGGESDRCTSIGVKQEFTFTSNSKTAPTAGPYTVKAVADSQKDVPESDEGNNENTANITVLPNTGYPDQPPIIDFNLDGLPDLIFQDANGLIAYWSMEGCQRRSTGRFEPMQVDPQRALCAAGDFTQDGAADLIFQHKDPKAVEWEVHLWHMDGPARKGFPITFGRDPAFGWRVASAGDFDRDGDPDLLFQHTKGNMVCWIMQNGDWQSDVLINPLNPGDPGWQVVGSGDFNRDGNRDLVFQYSDGQLAVWIMNGLSLQKVEFPPRPDDASWRVGAVTDLDKDGDPDLVFQFRGTGGLAAWLMDGTGYAEPCRLPPIEPAGTWKLVGPK